MSANKNRRFIAGAVCPRCGEMDKLFVYAENDDNYRACVSCDFEEKMHFPSKPAELDTRVNVTSEKKARQTSVVKLTDPDMN